MKACVILHNMIVEDEGEMAKYIDLNAIPGASIVLPPEVQKAPKITHASMMFDVEILLSLLTQYTLN
jgi:hypothetical protein